MESAGPQQATLSRRFTDSLTEIESLSEKLADEGQLDTSIFISSLSFRLRSWGLDINADKSLDVVSQMPLLDSQIDQHLGTVQECCHSMCELSLKKDKSIDESELDDLKFRCDRSVDNLSSLSEPVKTINKTVNVQESGKLDQLNTRSIRSAHVRRSYLLLDSVIPEKHARDFLGSVALNPWDPTTHYVPAPVNRSDNNTTVQLTEIKDWTVSQSASRSSFWTPTQLTRGIDIKAPRVQRLELTNANAWFSSQDQDWIRSVSEHIQKSKKGKGYLIVGIMVARDLSLTSHVARSSGVHASVEIPLAAVTGLAVGGDVSASRSGTNERTQTYHFNNGEDVIFALKYAVVRRKAFSRKLSITDYVAPEMTKSAFL